MAWLGLAVMLLCAAPAAAQVLTDERLWANFTVQERAGTESPWRWYFELQGRTRNGVDDFDQLVVRPAVGYDLTRRSSVWVGYGYTPFFLATGDVLTENRAWQQYLWAAPAAGGTFQSRTRLEQRWLEGADVAWRLRQFVRFNRQVSARGGLAVVGWDEYFLQLNDTARAAQGFDRNRFFGGLSVGAGRHARVEAGYMNEFVQGVRALNRRNHVAVAILNLTY